jgi:ketosteroid isomerase-like protein
VRRREDEIDDASDDVRRVLERYYVALDRGDCEAAGGCFARDAVARYDVPSGPCELRGRDAVVDFLRRHLPPTSTHLVATQSIEVTGETARSLTFVVAFLKIDGVGGDTVAVRGLSYDDRLASTSDGWMIVERTHQVRWQFDAPSASLTIDPSA